MIQTEFIIQMAFLFHNYNIVVAIQMISCSCRPFNHSKVLSLQFYHKASVLKIYVIDESKDIILISNITSETVPKSFLSIFGADLWDLYQYLSQEDCQITVSDEQTKIVLLYQMVSILGERLTQTVRLPTNVYIQTTRRLSLTTSQSDSVPNQLRKPLTSEREVICDGCYDIKSANTKQVIEEVGQLQGHSNWFYNKNPRLFLQLANVLYLPREDLRSQDNKTYRFSIDLNRFHVGDSPKYDLTFGLAHQNSIQKLRNKFQENVDKTISIEVKNRWIYCQCMHLRERRQFDNVVYPQSLQLYVSHKRVEKGDMYVNNIQMFLNQHKLVNIFSEYALQPVSKSLEDLEEYVPFLYLHRSFLHFSYKTSIILI